ncbi:insulin-like peptide receptor [Drosophila guanche]|uniref:Blast:Insulin receptor n=1 Tax=Drosophila guanche TaxID=7266 RepID=A0A3B0JSZ2_DROGU|nr:insulin-like peptide receptor [Drosophila guanche]SPP83522.1 blast:Insulin receptor [Drosophila guanche]
MRQLPLLFCFTLWPVLARCDTICGSLEINKVADFQKLQNCTHVIGHVRIANVDLPSESNASLELLSSNVSEISDYLMVYRCTGLLTLEAIFPKLRIIRGQALLFDQYALVVHENRNLRELGLVELLRIQNGLIRIETNPMLCFVETVDWMHLLSNATQQHFSLKHNKPSSHCPVCGGLAADYAFRQNISDFCWNMNTAQIRLTPPRLKGCPTACGLHGCDNVGNCCKGSCVTGCSDQNCTLCGNYQSKGKCVDQCVISYELHKRQCISYKECRQLGMIPLTRGYRCVDKCPPNQKEVSDPNGLITCQVECKGVYHVRSGADLEPLQDCVTINGSLIIELTDIKEKIVAPLEKALASVKEITGYLKVLHSAQLMSLSFLQNLDVIRGDQLIENKYALFVVNNHHLENIWTPNHQVLVQRGSIFFHLNPRLCHEKILQLEPSLKSVQHISVAEVSPNSNGERVICGDAVRTLKPVVDDISATAVRILLDYMDWEGMETLIGYSYYYKEAPQRNVTMYDGRHGCGHDNWLMDVSATKSRRHVISGLKPYTQYAFFVKTLTRTDYHMQIDAYSQIRYFQTLPDKPSPVARIYGSSELSTQILLHWWPPRRPNGIISKYYVTFEPHNLTNAEKGKNYLNPRPANVSLLDCQCDDVTPYDSGPQPNDEDYYNKEQITYEDALPNLIYVSRRQEQPKKDKFEKVIDFDDLRAGMKQEPTTTPAPTTPAPTRPAPSNLTNVQEKMAAVRYDIYRNLIEQRQRAAQDLDICSLQIPHAMKKCQDDHATVSQRLEEKCTIEEEMTGIQVPGNQHYFYLNELQPESFYRVTVRACVDDVLNGCSNPTEALVKTTSVRVEQLMKST